MRWVLYGYLSSLVTVLLQESARATMTDREPPAGRLSDQRDRKSNRDRGECKASLARW